jgi:outer membrane receptor protein involved in Fe transport
MRISSKQRSSLSFAGFAALMLAAPTALAQAAAPPSPPPAQPPAAQPAPAEPPPAAQPAPVAAPAAVQDAPVAADPTTEVVISATRRARDPFNTPTGVTAVRAHEMARHPAASTAEQLRDTPGIWGGEGFVYSTPVIRGLTGNQMLVLVDGVRMNTATAFGGDNRVLQMFDVESLDRIEVVRGPSSVMWGTDALGGSIHVFTKAPPAWVEDGTRFEGKLSASLGSVDAMQRFHGEAGVATKHVRARAGFTSLFVGDLHTAGSLGVMSPSGWKGRSLDTRIDFRPSPQNVISVIAQNQEIRDAQSYELAYTRPLSLDASRLLGILRFEHNPDWTNAPAEYTYARDYQAQFSVHRQGEVTHNMLNGQDSSTQTLSFAGDVQIHAPVFSMLDVIYGAHAHGDLAESAVNSLSKGKPVRTRSFPTSGWENLAAFANADFHPIKWISVLGGVRADVFRLNSDPDALSVPNGLTIEQLRISQTSGAVTGSLGVVGHVLPWMNVVASVSRGFRAANVNDQLSSGPFRAGYNFPTPGLKPESSVTFEGGFHFKVPKLFRAELTAWYSLFRDSISSVLRNPDVNSDDCVDVNGNGKCDPNEHVFVKNNLGKSHNLGVELSGQVNLPYGISPYVVGTWMKQRDDVNDAPLARLPPTNATIGVKVEPPRAPLHFYIEPYVRLVAPISSDDILCSAIFTDAAYRTDPRDSKSPLIGSLKLSDDNKTCSGSTPGYATVSIRGGATITSFLDLAMEVRNLGNAAYRDTNTRYDGGGIGAFGTLTLHHVDE